MPTPQQACSILLDKFLHAPNFSSTKAATILQSDGFQPKFSFIVITFNVNMRWLVAITGIKEKSIRPAPQYSWHCFKLRLNHENLRV